MTENSADNVSSMDGLISKITGMVLNQPIRGDDIVDRMHYFVTVAILLLFAFGTGLQEYVGSPIDCWTPLVFPQGSDPYHLHINSYCWAHQMSFPKFQKENMYNETKSNSCKYDQAGKLKDKFDTAFYRWVTLILIVQACLFKIPNFLWHQASASSGADLEKIRDLVLKAQTADDEGTRNEKLDKVVAFLEKWIIGYRPHGPQSKATYSLFNCFGKRSGNYLSSLYLVMKILNFLNVVGNMFLMAVFLDVNFWRYGFDVINGVFVDGDWGDSCNFPRLLICNFILEGGDVSNPGGNKPQEIEIQCAMTINLLLEKILVLEWFWLMFILIITVVNLVSWWIKITPPTSTALFYRSYQNNLFPSISVELGLETLKTEPLNLKTPECTPRKFVEEYLRSDGVLVLKLLELNSNREVVGDVIGHLRYRYQSAIHRKSTQYTLESRCEIDGTENIALEDKERYKTEVEITE